MTGQIPTAVQERLGLLLAVWRDEAQTWRRVTDVYTAYRHIVAPGSDTAGFDAQLDDLIGRGYVDTDDTSIDLSDYGRLCLFSLAELVDGEFARVRFDRLSDAGWQLVFQVVERLPARYGSRGGDYFVYVVLLHNDVKRLRRYQEANSEWQPGFPALYVGMSSHAPLQRFRNHKRGHKSSRYVRKYGLCLLPEHFGHLNPLDRYGAEEMESDLAADLRSQGYGVMGVYETGTSDTADYADVADSSRESL